MHCPSCGKPIKVEDNFCSDCGKDLKSKDSIKPETESIDPTPQDKSQFTRSLPKRQNTATKNSHSAAILPILLSIFVIWVIIKYSIDNPPSSSPAETQASTSQPATIQPSSPWKYSENTDPMTSATTKFAIVHSTNSIEFGFPYQGKQKMNLVLRKKGSTNAMINIERGQFICPGIRDCYVRLRFDEGKPENFLVSQPTDHSTTTLFIENSHRLITSLKKAKKLRIEATFYQEGSIVTEFDISDLDWK